MVTHLCTQLTVRLAKNDLTLFPYTIIIDIHFPSILISSTHSRSLSQSISPKTHHRTTPQVTRQTHSFILSVCFSSTPPHFFRGVIHRVQKISTFYFHRLYMNALPLIARCSTPDNSPAQISNILPSPQETFKQTHTSCPRDERRRYRCQISRHKPITGFSRVTVRHICLAHKLRLLRHTRRYAATAACPPQWTTSQASRHEARQTHCTTTIHTDLVTETRRLRTHNFSDQLLSSLFYRDSVAAAAANPRLYALQYTDCPVSLPPPPRPLSQPSATTSISSIHRRPQPTTSLTDTVSLQTLCVSCCKWAELQNVCIYLLWLCVAFVSGSHPPHSSTNYIDWTNGWANDRPTELDWTGDNQIHLLINRVTPLQFISQIIQLTPIEPNVAQMNSPIENYLS